MDMASQPNNCSEDVSEINFINFHQMVFDTNDFNHAYNDLTLRLDNGPLTTPDLQITNPLIVSNSGSQINANHDMPKTNFQKLWSMDFDKELSISSVANDEEIDVLLSEIEAISNGMNCSTYQQVTANAQEAIEAIANDLRNAAQEVSDDMDRQTIFNAMKRHHRHPVMTIRVQPIGRQRFRYQTDGQRYLKGSKKSPMSTNLPRLDGCLTKPDQSFWIQVTLVTTRRNPHGKVFYHQYYMIYTGENAERIGSQSFRIPLTDEDILQRFKEFRYLSIFKAKQEDYDFQLIPFDPLIPDDHMIDYTLEDDDELTHVQKSKRFDVDYHTEEFQIVCQLLIRQKDQWHTTDLYCQTHVITDI